MFELFQDCSHRMAFVLTVLILQFSSSVYHNISASSVVVIWTRTVSCHVLAFELGNGGDQWSQHSLQSRRDSNWVRCLCACETLSIHRPSRCGEEWLINCFLAPKEIRPGTGHLRSRSFAREKILHYIFFFLFVFLWRFVKRSLSHRGCCRPIEYQKKREREREKERERVLLN